MKKIFKVLINVGVFLFIAYVFIFVLFKFNSIFFDIKKELPKTRLAILNNSKPYSFEYLINVNNINKKDMNKLKRYIKYYEKIIEFIPKQAEAYGLAGFCYFQLGQDNKAMSFYKKAIDINPNFFWYHYNLGVIYLKNNKYNDGLKLFEKALKLNPQNTLSFILRSKMLYSPIVSERRYSLNDLTLQLQLAYKDSYIIYNNGIKDLNHPLFLLGITDAKLEVY